MTSVLSYPMPETFASPHHSPRLPPHQHQHHQPTTRYSSPPFAPAPVQIAPPLFASTSASASPSQTSLSSTIPQQGHNSRRSSPAPGPFNPDEFGVHQQPSTPTYSQSTRPIQSPTMLPQLPIPDTIASSSASNNVSRKRQSHNPSATLKNSPPRPEQISDEYVLHPSVAAYKSAHPRRPSVAFGPYVLLQTLGEGEFGKVKLGVHTEFGVEVAIKLIRRGSLDDEVRANKVEREIDVLKTLRHPNLVRMFDVIDTEKYIGIVLEFAGGGELFDHILANRYLKEKDAAKLFAQLISGVDYLHKKHIVHRDLKLENLLLDKHRNVIITDFGFANRFEQQQDDLMATSCGSPCYAAPELVVSEGLYVGTAVDIWSCGVILYAMLSGFLPYDDDPANPEGDNINLLYKYIMSTRLNFPDHISPQAKHLLQIMLVPNPEYRCTVQQIMDHPWLAAHRELFSRTVDEHEAMSQINMSKKSTAARRELAERKRMQMNARNAAEAERQSTRPMATASLLDQTRRIKESRHHSALPGATTMPEFLNNAGRMPPIIPLESNIVKTEPPRERAESMLPVLTTVPLATSAPEVVPLQEEVKPPMSQNKNRHTIQVEYDGDASYERMKEALEAKNRDASVKEEKGKGLEVVPKVESPAAVESVASDVEMESESEDYHERERPGTPPGITAPPADILQGPSTPVKSPSTQDVGSPTTPRASSSAAVENPTTPRAPIPFPSSASTPRARPSKTQPKTEDQSNVITKEESDKPSPLNAAGLPNIPIPRKDRSRKGMSLDKFGLAKLLGQAQSAQEGRKAPPSSGGSAAAIQAQVAKDAAGQVKGHAKRSSVARPSTAASVDEKKSRRKTLQLMVTRSNSITRRSGAQTPLLTTVPEPSKTASPVIIDSGGIQPPQHDRAPTSPSIVTIDAVAAQAAGHPGPKTASSSAAKKVMDWFRRKSLAKDTLVGLKASTTAVRNDSASSFVRVSASVPRSEVARDAQVDVNLAMAMSSTSSIGHETPSIHGTDFAPVNEAVKSIRVASPPRPTRAPLSSAANKTNISSSDLTDSIPTAPLPRSKSHRSSAMADSVRMPPPSTPTTTGSGMTYSESKMQIHTGLVDQSALSSKPPQEVMAEVIRVLQAMGMEIKKENEFRLRCTRVRRKKAGAVTGLGLSSVISTGSGLSPFNLMGNASASRTDSRGLPIPSSPSILSSSGLKGMLLRRGSSYSSHHPAMSRSESDMFGSPSASSAGLASPALSYEPLYGEHSVDNGDEVKFNVELCKIKNLPGLYLLNIKRLKGSLWSFKFIYQTVLERCETLTH